MIAGVKEPDKPEDTPIVLGRNRKVGALASDEPNIKVVA
jgi:hypothetical protein